MLLLAEEYLCWCSGQDIEEVHLTSLQLTLLNTSMKLFTGILKERLLKHK